MHDTTIDLENKEINCMMYYSPQLLEVLDTQWVADEFVMTGLGGILKMTQTSLILAVNKV